MLQVASQMKGAFLDTGGVRHTRSCTVQVRVLVSRWSRRWHREHRLGVDVRLIRSALWLHSHSIIKITLLLLKTVNIIIKYSISVNFLSDARLHLITVSYFVQCFFSVLIFLIEKFKKKVNQKGREFLLAFFWF